MANRIQELQALLQEFFSPSVNTERKQELESRLLVLRSDPDTWHHCRDFLTASDSELVQWFALAVYDHLLRHGWRNLSSEERAQERRFIFMFLCERWMVMTPLVRNKTAKLVVDIARIDWPHEDPEFLMQVSSLAQQAQTARLGLLLVRLVIEEMLTPREEDVNAERRAQLKSLLTPQLPSLLNLLFTLIQRYSTEPPPGMEVCQEALETVSQLMGAIPLGDVFTPPMFASLFALTQRRDTVGQRALTCVNDMLSKNCLPRDFEDFLIQCFSTLRALFPVVNDSLDDAYKDQLFEFAEQLLASHVKRVEQHPSFALMDILQELYRVTFEPNDVSIFKNCLKCWSAFVDISQVGRYESGFYMVATGLVKRVLFLYSANFLKQLDDAPGSGVSEEDEYNIPPPEDGDESYQNLTQEPSELDVIVRDTLNIVSKIASAPANTTGSDSRSLVMPVLQQSILPPFQELASLYVNVHNEASQERGSCICRDVDTILCAITGLVSEFLGQDSDSTFAAMASQAATLLGYFCDIATYATSNASSLLSKYGASAERAHAQSYLTIASFGEWLRIAYDRARRPVPGLTLPYSLSDVEGLYTRVINASAAAIFNCHMLPERVVSSAIRALHTITCHVRPPIATSETIQALFQTARQVAQTPSSAALAPQLYTTLTNVIILPPYHTKPEEAGWESRGRSLKDFLADIVQALCSLASGESLEQRHHLVPDTVAHTVIRFKILTSIVRSVTTESRESKTCVWMAVADTLPLALSLLPMSTSCTPLVDVIIAYFLANVEAFKGQLGSDYITKALDICFKLFATPSQDSCKPLVKFLTMLTWIAREPSPVFRPFVTDICNFCVESLFPLYGPLETEVGAEVRPKLFLVVRHILVTHYNVFTPSTIMSNQQGGGLSPSAQASSAHLHIMVSA
eukprot:TRINITY_DN7621_c0_g1::TRINITY_DN7621_c0_g1_i1::g.18566::m.18566 TRINITY_DN7621_c0_g1::TRINITY_DN7621_c0_g1_i1::g.18566  ORF type:complete len:915 (+),score=173.36,sp/Q924Z6/XPO6_MOUSE/22.29/4e-65,Xpo1/PF08389.7/5.3e-16,Xpo1/PF08389.7/3.4e+02,Xpo1/PF08389.7/2.6e+03,Xpo1/PF08389.7/5.4e+03 TRINITY_DN7621_c0_g1_i1:103-2847(+)